MPANQTDSGATTGYEPELWAMADALRGSMDAAEYKHVVLGLIFLKYISDAFEERRAAVLAERGEEAAEDRDEYVAENIFRVPQEARWARLKAEARQPTVGQTVARAMAAIERDNPALKEVLPKDYARPALDKQRLGQLIDMVGNIRVGDAEARSKDVLGRVYEYCLSRFAKMNLAIRGIGGQIAHGDSFHYDRHPDLKADYILANPPFNVSDWGGERLAGDRRRRYGVPPKGNANFAWVQHMVHHLAPSGVAGFVLANGSMSSQQSGEGEIRKNLVEAELVDCMVALPGQLSYSTQIPACLWFLARGRRRRGEILSSTRGSSAGWWTGRTANRPARRSSESRTRITRGGRARTVVRMFPASARARRWARCGSTATSSRRAGMSGSNPMRMTASRSMSRCGGWSRSLGNSRPRALGSTPRSRRHTLVRASQKRHLIAHRMGVVD